MEHRISKSPNQFNQYMSSAIDLYPTQPHLPPTTYLLHMAALVAHGGRCEEARRPMLAFDHRCHVPDAGLNTAYIAPIRQCLDTLLRYRSPQLQARYAMPRSVLRPFLRRAWLMRTRGYDALREGPGFSNKTR